jgi:hypothetical protein
MKRSLIFRYMVLVGILLKLKVILKKIGGPG